jgi:hypothetical protein
VLAFLRRLRAKIILFSGRVPADSRNAVSERRARSWKESGPRCVDAGRAEAMREEISIGRMGKEARIQ